MIRHDFAQGSLEWLEARAGIPTASEFSNLLTPEFKMRTGEMPNSYLCAKLAEAWIQGPLPGFSSWDTEQGKVREDEAIPWLAFERGIEVQRVGLVTTDEGRIGCSPDGLIGDDNGLEVKCPSPTVHVKYLLANELPKDYVCQVHGAMYVTGRPQWTFLSYHRKFPALLLTIERDEEIIASIDEALTMFLNRFDCAMERMIEINGGPPPKRAPRNLTGEPIRFSWESDPNDVPIP